MKCKKIFLLLICVLLVTGCSAKSYGTKLNKKKVELNKQKIRYLSNKYNYTNIEFLERIQSTISCECKHGFWLDGNICFDKKCKYSRDKFVWKYRVCSNEINYFCIDAKYDDLTQEWNLPDYEYSFSYILNVINSLKNNNITFKGYKDGIDRYFTIIVKKEDNTENLVKAFEEIKLYYLNNPQVDYKASVLIVEADDYEKILNRFNSDSLEYNGVDEFLKNSFVSSLVTEYREIGSDMFDCDKTKYSTFMYEFVTNYSKREVTLYCKTLDK